MTADRVASQSPSRIRDTAASTFDALNDKYAKSSKTNGNGNGSVAKSKRVKIFDDDVSDDEEEVVRYGEDGLGDMEDDEGDDDLNEEDEEEDEEEEEEESYDEEVDGDLDASGNGQPEDEEEEDEEEDYRSFKPSLSALSSSKSKSQATDQSKSAKVLDPMSALKSAKAKDVEKGEGIRRQQVCGP